MKMAMEDTKITTFSDSIQKKLGDDVFATIADDIGTLITENAEVQKSLQEQQQTIKNLTSRNEMLTASNGSLLKQIGEQEQAISVKSPFGNENGAKKEESLSADFDFTTLFGADGKFKTGA